MKYLKTILLTTLITSMAQISTLLAQPSLPGDPSQAPIDGGLIWLLLGGGAYGIKKLRDGGKESDG